MSRSFQITFDYLCPFARNANEHVVEGLRGGADWDVRFLPYSLAQGHVEEGGTAVWDLETPDEASGILALLVGLTVRDHFPAHFLDVHQALFAARHDDGHDIKDVEVLRSVLEAAGLAPDAVLALATSDATRELLRSEHDEGVEKHQVWGVPTFITDRRAVFVRVLDRPDGDASLATTRVDHIVDLVDTPLELHEFKQVDLPV